jgi:hypothetical protein
MKKPTKLQQTKKQLPVIFTVSNGDLAQVSGGMGRVRGTQGDGYNLSKD